MAYLIFAFQNMRIIEGLIERVKAMIIIDFRPTKKGPDLYKRRN